MEDPKITIVPEAEKPAEAPAQGQPNTVKGTPPEQTAPSAPGKVVDFTAGREESDKDMPAAQKPALQTSPADKSDGADKPVAAARQRLTWSPSNEKRVRK